MGFSFAIEIKLEINVVYLMTPTNAGMPPFLLTLKLCFT